MSDKLPPLPPGFWVEPTPNEAAVAWLKGKPVVASSVFRRLIPELKARAVAVAGIESAGVLRTLRDAIAEVPAGADWDKQKRQLADLLQPYLADPEEPKNKNAARRKAELLLRTHGFQAYAVGQHEVMVEQVDVFPWWQYLTMSDLLVRPTHSALDKLIFPANSSFWRKHSPPWDWGCRCRKVPLLPSEVDEVRSREAKKGPESKTVIEGEALMYVEQVQKLDRGPNKIFDLTPPSEKRSDAFLFEPDALRLSPAQLRERYDPATWSDFESWAKKTPLADDGLTVWAWMSGESAPVVESAVRAGPVAPRTLDSIKSELSPLQVRAEKARAARAEGVRAWNDARFSSASLPNGVLESIESAENELSLLAELAREAVSLPVASRGTVKYSSIAPSCSEVAAAGAELAARYTHSDVLPVLVVKYNASKRAFHRGGEIHVNSRTSVSTVMHEITHGTEQQTPSILEAARRFLLKRANGERTRTLRRLTGNPRYRADEYAFEDEFAKRGGHHYMGKDYGSRATEILTMGIERLHADPLGFASDDPEYFDFVLSTLQKL